MKHCTNDIGHFTTSKSLGGSSQKLALDGWLTFTTRKSMSHQLPSLHQEVGLFHLFTGRKQPTYIGVNGHPLILSTSRVTSQFHEPSKSSPCSSATSFPVHSPLLSWLWRDHSKHHPGWITWPWFTPPAMSPGQAPLKTKPCLSHNRKINLEPSTLMTSGFKIVSGGLGV